MKLSFVSETSFYAYPIQQRDKIALLWDDQLEAIPVSNLHLASGSYEVWLLAQGMAIRRNPSWGDWQDRVFALSSSGPHFFNISVEEMLFFCPSQEFSARKINKPWQELLTARRAETKEEFPRIELEAPSSLIRARLRELKQRPDFLGLVVRGVRARHVVIRQSPGYTYLVCLYGPEEMRTVWSCYPDATQVWVESQAYWLEVCREQWQRIVGRHPQVLGSR